MLVPLTMIDSVLALTVPQHGLEIQRHQGNKSQFVGLSCSQNSLLNVVASREVSSSQGNCVQIQISFVWNQHGQIQWLPVSLQLLGLVVCQHLEEDQIVMASIFI